MTRIIGGSARGRRLAVPTTGTRPTADRVREAVFSTLESELASTGRAWADVAVLDLFAGSGAFGLEALSRGAREATLVEKSRAAARVLTANAATLGLPGTRILVKDARQLPAQPAPMAGADICFADPPYETRSEDIRDLLGSLATAGWLAGGATVLVERPARSSESPLPRGWPDPRQRPYGDTCIWYGQAPLSDGMVGAPTAGESG